MKKGFEQVLYNKVERCLRSYKQFVINKNSYYVIISLRGTKVKHSVSDGVYMSFSKNHFNEENVKRWAFDESIFSSPVDFDIDNFYLVKRIVRWALTRDEAIADLIENI
jgi:hypothetical protein